MDVYLILTLLSLCQVLTVLVCCFISIFKFSQNQAFQTIINKDKQKKHPISYERETETI